MQPSKTGPVNFNCVINKSRTECIALINKTAKTLSYTLKPVLFFLLFNGSKGPLSFNF